MVSVPMEVYLDFSLRRKVESIVINANKVRSQQSDLNVFFLTNKFKVEGDKLVSKKVTTSKTFFLRFIDEAGDINFKMIKSAHFGNIIESDFETISYYPTNPSEFANYYEGHEVPDEGGWLYFAYCPFGENHIELLNGDVIKTCGGIGKVFITKEQRGFKGYKQIPRVPAIFEMGPYKILKLVVHTQWEPYGPQNYSLNLFAPDMEEVEESEYESLSIDDSFLCYVRADNYSIKDNGVNLVNLINNKDDIPINAEIKDGSPIVGISKNIYLGDSGYIDFSNYGEKISGEFTIHCNFAVHEYAPKGTVIFEGAYGIDEYGNQTHHLTLFLNNKGEICYNTRFNDQVLNTKVQVPLNTYTTLTFVNANTKMLENEQDAYASFIFLNGRQIWPKETYLNPDEKEILLRAYKAYETYSKVCLNLELNNSTVGALDVKAVCIKKLLKESGFMNIEVLEKLYSLWNMRPYATSVDLGDIILGSDDDKTIKKMYFGQDSYLDILEKNHYFNGEFYDLVLINRALTRDEIGKISLFNALGYPSLGVSK